MYERLTALIPLLKAGKNGEVSSMLETEISRFLFEHRDSYRAHYADVLKKHGIKWEYDSMSRADVNKLDGTAVIALLTGAFRGDVFCNGGVLLNFCKDGCILRWLNRLEQIDKGRARRRER